MLPRDWFPQSLKGVKLLCLAGAGGQQAPICAALGADVTVLDISENMLLRDKMVAEQENLSINIEHGNMCDLSRFANEKFDLILSPPSLFYVPDVMPVYQECYRIMTSGWNPFLYSVLRIGLRSNPVLRLIRKRTLRKKGSFSY